MPLTVWTKPSGTSLGIVTEQTSVYIALPVNNTVGVTYTLISGRLPSGVFIVGSHLIGSPFVYDNQLKFNFCIRARAAAGISDRTFTLDVLDPNVPTFITNAGALAIGLHKQLYVLDGTYVDYQIEAFNLNPGGQALTYFIGSEDGALPPGLTLSNSGRITGYVIPQPTLTPESGNGFYDGSIYDLVAFDSGILSNDGFDDYGYDEVFFDFSVPTRQIISLNTNYQFQVTLTDGIDNSYRIFRIFVVGDDTFRADSTTHNGLAGTFSADATYIRQPYWISNSNLGLFRANNYLTIPLALYDDKVISFRLETTNQEVYANAMKYNTFDNTINSRYVTITNTRGIPKVGQYFSLEHYLTGAAEDIYQISQVTDLTNNTYRLFIYNKNTTNNISFFITGVTTGSNLITVSSISNLSVGTEVIFNNGSISSLTGGVYFITAISAHAITVSTTLGGTNFNVGITSAGLITAKVVAGLTVNLPNGTPFYIGSLSQLPTGTKFDEQTGDVYGVVPYQPAITKKYTFTITSTRYGNKTDSVSASKTFYISIIGDITSQIVWNTSKNLGTIPANYICTLSVSATSSVPDTNVIYSVVDGMLPPGITLNPDGELIGTVNQFYKPVTNTLGLITFDRTIIETTFDQTTTSFNRNYTFTIKASDEYNYTATNQTFTLTISTPNTVPYSNILTRPFLDNTQRTYWSNFINNTNIFTPSSIYRTTDLNFGVQTSLNMLVYAGIQTVDAAAYVGAMGLNHKRKRFQFGKVKKAVAIDPSTGKSVYEVVYVQMIDPAEVDSKHLPLSVKTNSRQSPAITVDESTSIWSRTIDDLSSDAPEARRPDLNITVDSSGYTVSNSNVDTYFPNSISNWRNRIKNISNTQNERNYLPLWMRSIPSGSKKQLGYTLAVPLCFCQLGTADTILLNIKFSGFDFKTIDYTVERYIINAVLNSSNQVLEVDKYLVFRNDRITV